MMSEKRIINPEEVAKRLDQRDVVEEVLFAALDSDLGQIIINFPASESTKVKEKPRVLETIDDSPITDTPSVGNQTSLLERVDDLLVDLGDSVLNTGRQLRDKLSNNRVGRRGVIGAGIVATVASSAIVAPAVATEQVVVSDESVVEESGNDEYSQEFVISFKEDKKTQNPNANSRDKEDQAETTPQVNSGITDSGDTSTEGVIVSNYVSVESSNEKSDELESTEKPEEPELAEEPNESAIKVNFDQEPQPTEEKPASDDRGVEKQNNELPPETSEVEPDPEATIEETNPVTEDVVIQPDSNVDPKTPVTESIQVSFPEDITTEVVPEMDEPEIEIVISPPVESSDDEDKVEQVPQASPAKIIVEKGQTLSEIARNSDTTVKELARLNDIKNVDLILIDQEIKIPNIAEKVIVTEGQTLSEIANTFDVSVESIVAANDLVDQDIILIGQELDVPTSLTEAVPSESIAVPETIPNTSVDEKHSQPRLSENFSEVLEKGPLLDSVEAFAQYAWDQSGDGLPDHPLLNDIWNNWDRSNLAQALFELGNAGWIDYDKGVELVLSDIVQSEGYSYRYGNDGDDFDRNEAIDMNRNLLRTLVATAVLLPKDKLYIANLTDGGHIGNSNHFTDRRGEELEYGLGNAVDFGHSGQADWLNLIGDGLVLNQDTIGGFRELILGHPDFDNQINHGKRYTPSAGVAAGHSGNNLHGHLSFLQVLTDDPGAVIETESTSEPVIEESSGKTEEIISSENIEKDDKEVAETASFEKKALEQKEKFLDNLNNEVRGVSAERVKELFILMHDEATRRGIHITDEGYVAVIAHAWGESRIQPEAKGGAGEGGIWQWKGPRANGADGSPADLTTLEKNVQHFFYDASKDSNFLEDIQNPDLDLHEMVTEGYKYERPSSWFDADALAPKPPLKERSKQSQAGSFRWGVAEEIWEDLQS